VSNQTYWLIWDVDFNTLGLGKNLLTYIDTTVIVFIQFSISSVAMVLR